MTDTNQVSCGEARFDAHWLALREPADHRARDGALAERLALIGEATGWQKVLDLGCGTGSNLRYLAPRLPWAREWTLLDQDAALLSRLAMPENPVVEVIRVQGRLEHEGLEAVAQADLVSASALLDLVSATWLDQLIDAIQASGAAALFTLNYAGEVFWQGKPDPDDDWMQQLVNQHQQGEKGMGVALGPDAVLHACARFRRLGYRCETAPSPWRLRGAEDGRLASAWMRGWADAARSLVPEQAGRVQDWLARRTRHFTLGELEIRVAHLDLLALPAEEASQTR